jgi:hypothetical protein
VSTLFHRCGVTLAAALLAAQTVGAGAQTAPPRADLPLTDLPLVSSAVFQNACHAARQEQARAEAEGREPENVVTSGMPAWRRALSDFSRYGPIEPRYCWSPAQAPDDDPPRDR